MHNRPHNNKGINYPVSLFYLYTTPEEAYEVYAMDLKDAYECLLENEPNLTINDIILVKEHRCPTKKEIVN